MTTPDAKPLILLVDDTPANLDLVTEALADNYELSVAIDGESALQIVRTYPPQLILLDIMMPGMDGYEVCRRLKADERTRDIPVLFLTALDDDEDEAKGLGLGAIDYITKPFNPSLVKARVRNHLALATALRTVGQQRDAIDAAYRDLQELEKHRDSLVHMIVHDMGSPLMGLCGNLEIASLKLGSKLAPAELRPIDHALHSANRLSEMVRSLLEINRLESGVLPLQPRDCDLGQLLQQAQERLGSMLPEGRVALSSPSTPATASVDSEILIRVVVNLLSNAVKHTPEGTDVDVAYGTDEHHVFIRVQDHGQGIAPEFHDHIFEKFGQAESRRKSGGYHSTGLGLTFCKLAVEAHGGTIHVESELGHGATFVVRLPKRPV